MPPGGSQIVAADTSVAVPLVSATMERIEPWSRGGQADHCRFAAMP
jgi:hypothetical protein